MSVLITPAHSQQVSNHYHIVYPDHAPREQDSHYAAFNAYRKAHVATAVCFVGQRVGYDECAPGLELHHQFLEFAVINEVSLTALQVDYPDLTDAEKVGAWAESDPNFMWLCAKHHRGYGGAHHAAYADFEAGLYVQNLLSK